MNTVFGKLTALFEQIHINIVHFLHPHVSPSRHWLSGSHFTMDTITLCLLLTFSTMMTLFVHYRGKVNLREQLELLRKLNEGLRTSGNMEDNLTHILSIVSQVVIAPYYAFYIWDSRSLRFILRAASHPYDLFEGVGPAYSGLALPKKEAYLPPSVLANQDTSEIVSLVHEGDVPLLILKIGETHGLIRLGPVTRVNRKQKRILRELAATLIGPVEDYINLERDRLKLELQSLSDGAINKIASLASNTMGTIDILLHAFKGIVGGPGGLFIQREETGRYRLHAPHELGDTVRSLESDPASLDALLASHSVGDEQIVVRSDAEFYNFPVSITSRDDVGAIVIVPFDQNHQLLMLLDDGFDLNEWKAIGSRQLSVLIQQVAQMTKQAPVQDALKRGYTRILCEIADFVDNLNPFTVGYSDMMTHYCLAVGRTLGLSDLQMADLALASRLSNIGVIGIDMSLLVKEGKYSDFEYNLMQRHSEISASMIELVTGNKSAAEYVLHHHERVDGQGYPMHLYGDEIPLPSKIMHVIQVFLAKINGRKWRKPLSFEFALRELKASVGTSLDGEVVTAFEHWWEEQAVRQGGTRGNLGYCYEMCCVPRSICEGCSALQNPLKCWEFPDNQCRFHGRDCATCFVKTEYDYRVRMGYVQG